MNRFVGFPLSTALLIIVGGCHAKGGASDLKIVNGSPVTESQNHDAIGATAAILKSNGEQFCTGTLIHPRIVLTAAHCLTSTVTPAAVTFELDAEQASYSEMIAVSQSHSSPEYESSNHDNDYGFLILETDAPRVPTPIISASEESSYLEPGTQLLLVGYGITYSGGNDNGIKRKAMTKVADSSSTQFNTQSTDTDTCQGDSGGPAFSMNLQGEWRIVGITSWGIGCGNNGYYARASLATCWIEQVSGVDLGTSDDCETSSTPSTPNEPNPPSSEPAIANGFFDDFTGLSPAAWETQGDLSRDDGAFLTEIGEGYARLNLPMKPVSMITALVDVGTWYGDDAGIVLWDHNDKYLLEAVIVRKYPSGYELVVGEFENNQLVASKSAETSTYQGNLAVSLYNTSYTVFLNGFPLLSGILDRPALKSGFVIRRNGSVSPLVDRFRID